MINAIYSVEVLNPEHYRSMFIYLITNKINGKRYIGKTSKTIEERWYHHCKSAARGVDTHLYNAVRKYTSESFTIEVIEENVNNLNERERYWIAEIKPEYNMTAGGDGGWINDQTGKTWKVKDASKMGKTFINGLQSRVIDYDLMRGGNNYQSQFFIHTPWGTFETWKDACSTAKELRKQGRKDVISDKETLRKYCSEDILLNKEGRRVYPEWRGMSTRKLGFYLETKNG